MACSVRTLAFFIIKLTESCEDYSTSFMNFQTVANLYAFFSKGHAIKKNAYSSYFTIYTEMNSK